MLALLETVVVVGPTCPVSCAEAREAKRTVDANRELKTIFAVIPSVHRNVYTRQVFVHQLYVATEEYRVYR
jgi:hypothetical protein